MLTFRPLVTIFLKNGKIFIVPWEIGRRNVLILNGNHSVCIYFYFIT